MALSNDYFEQRMRADEQRTRPVQTQPAQPSPLVSSPTPFTGKPLTEQEQVVQNLEGAKETAGMEAARKTGRRSTISYAPQVISEQIIGQRVEDWSEKSLFDKASLISAGVHRKVYGKNIEDYPDDFFGRVKMGAADQAKLAWKVIKGTGKVVAGAGKFMVETPPWLAATAFDLETRAFEKITGEKSELRMPRTFPTPFESDIGSMTLYYEGIKETLIRNGMSDGPASLQAAIGTTGETIFRGLAFIPAADAARVLLKTRFRRITPKITTKDPRRIKLEVAADTAPAISKTGKELMKPKVETFKDMPLNNNIIQQKLTASEAKAFGGNSNNTFVFIKPKANGLAETYVAQQRRGLTEFTKDIFQKKFGKSRIIPGETGPVIKLYSKDIKYDASFFQKQIPEKVGMEKMIYHGTPVDTTKIIKEGFVFGKHDILGPAGYFTDSKKLMDSFGENHLKLNVKDFNLKTFEMPQDRFDFEEKMGTKNLADAIRKEGKYDGFVIPNPHKEVGNTHGITNNELLNKILKAKDTKKVVEQPQSIDPFAQEKTIADDDYIPELMRKPVIGHGDKMIEDKQIRQVIGLAEDRQIDDVIVQALAKSQTTKNNIYDLTQDELYTVSETLRKFPKIKEKIEPFDVGRFESFYSLHRSWQPTFEERALARGLNYPVNSEIKVPMELGIRLQQTFREDWITKQDEIFKKYKKPKYAEHRRLLYSYAEGDINKILKNNVINETVKQELVEIGDWIKEAKNELWDPKLFGLSSSRFMNKHMSHIQKAGGINLLYKEKDMPPELRILAEFERKGQYNPLEDDAYINLQSYFNMYAQLKFVAEPYKHAIKVIDRLPPIVKERMTDWTQEVMGRADKYEKIFNDFGKRLHKKMPRFIPENVSPQITKGIMNLVYGGMIAGKVANVMRSFVSNSVMLNYANYGADYFMPGGGFFINGKDIKAMRADGFEVKGGVLYGKELAEMAGKGIIGKSFDIYGKINQAFMVTEGWPDLVARTQTYTATKNKFNKNIDLLKEEKITFEQFQTEFNMDRYHTNIQKIINGKILKGAPEDIAYARDLAIKEDIDQIQLGYRKGSGAAFHHGLRGKALGQFSTYSFGYYKTLKDWTARKQYDKIWRWLGVSAAIEGAFEEQLGLDASDWVRLGPISNIPFSPFNRVAVLTIDGIESAMGNMAKPFNENFEEISRTLRSSQGVLRGTAQQRIKTMLDMWSEYAREPLGPTYNEKGERMFVLRAKKTGKPNVTMDFWDTIKYGVGFSLKSIKKQWKALEIYNKKKTEEGRAEVEYIKLIIGGEIEKADKLYFDKELDFNPANRIKSYKLPVIKRVFESLGRKDKVKYWHLFAPFYEQE